MLAAAWSPCRLQAQESHIGFSVKYDDASGKLDEDNTKLLCNKIQQVIARSNAGCVSASEVLFAIRPELTITQDDVVRTGMQDIHVYQAELTLYAVGCADNNVFHSTIVQLKGNGRSQHEAERQMLTRLNASDPRLTRFIHTSQERIEEFFVNNAPVFIAKADLLAKQEGPAAVAQAALAAAEPENFVTAMVCAALEELRLF